MNVKKPGCRSILQKTFKPKDLNESSQAMMTMGLFEIGLGVLTAFSNIFLQNDFLKVFQWFFFLGGVLSIGISFLYKYLNKH